MRKLNKLVAILMLLLVVGITAPQTLAGDVGSPPTDIHQPGKAGDVQTPTLVVVVSTLAMILGLGK